MGLLELFAYGRTPMRASPSDMGPARIAQLYAEGVKGVAEQKLQEEKDASFLGFRPRREVRDVLRSGDVPGSAGDRAFAAIHRVEVWDDPSNDAETNDVIFRGSNIGQSSRSPNHGYRAGEDAKKYDDLKEGYVSDEELAEFDNTWAKTELLEAIAEMTDEEFDEYVDSLTDEERDTLLSILPPIDEDEVREQVASPTRTFIRNMRRDHGKEQERRKDVFPLVAKTVMKEVASSVANGTEPDSKYLHALARRVLAEHDLGERALPSFVVWARGLTRDEVLNLAKG
jgi:hypothetical protein